LPSSLPSQPRAQKEPKAVEDEITASLKKLKTLLENELISQEEYDAKKAEILVRL
jgi:predicted Zn-dependent peptidase